MAGEVPVRQRRGNSERAMPDDDNRKYWQQVARLYAPFMRRTAGARYGDLCARIWPRLDRQMAVLELACGSGQLSFELADRVRHWEATDYSDEMIAAARRRASAMGGGPKNLHFSVQDATALPHAPESFDAALIANALHVMPRPEVALGELWRVLRPGGWLFAPTFVQGPGALFRLRQYLMEWTGFHVFQAWGATDLARFIAGHGFEIVECACLGTAALPLAHVAAHKSAK